MDATSKDLHGPDLRTADVSIRLFGSIRFFWGDHEVPLPSRSAQALVALLALRGRPWSRESITAEIWPDADYGPPTRLRQAIWLVRRSLMQVGAHAAGALATDGEMIGFGARVRIDVDVARFEAHLGRRPPNLEAALQLYRGDLAEGLSLECLSVRREHLADQYEDSLALVAQARLAGADLDGARRAAMELLERDPLREDGHAILIEAYGIEGSRSKAHRQYARLRALLASELGADPLPETEVVYRGALAQALSRSADRVARLAPDERMVG